MIKFFAVVFLLIGTFSTSSAQDGVAMIVFVKGVVSIINVEGVAREATTKMLIKPKEKISTGKNSLAIIRLMDKSTLKIEQGGMLEILELITSYKTGVMGSSNFFLSSGRILVDVVKKYSGPPALEIKTSDSISFGVRGTNFLVDIDNKTKTVWCSVGTGEVEAFDHDKDDSELIAKGNSMAVTQGKSLTLPIKFQWAQKINWNTDPQNGELESMPSQIIEDRQIEEIKEEKKISVRKPKPFKKLLEQQRKEFAKKFRQEVSINTESTSASSIDSTISGPPPALPDKQKKKEHMKEEPNEMNARKACNKMAKAFNCHATKNECQQGYFVARKLGHWKVCVQKKYIK
jgi:hypothetical protein